MAGYVFICYSREDQNFAHQLAKNLKKRGVPVWLDQWDIPAGTDWDQAVEDALYDCSQMLIILSPISIKSREVRAELRTALDENKQIVPVLFKDCRLPRQLRLFEYVDFTSYQPDDTAALDRILLVLNVVDSHEQPKYRKAASRNLVEPAEQELSVPAKTFKNNIGMEFLLIPAGSFLMGSKLSPEENAKKYGVVAEYFEKEHPQHEVTITKPFYLQSTQVTQGQWQKVIGDNPSYFKKCGDDCPVENVSWDNAQDFIKKLNEKEKSDKYRLPTEAEWEYVCRAGTATEFSFGDDADKLDDYAWYDTNSEDKTHPVGQKKPNPWGLYDMPGNVFEWCQDWYGHYPSNPVVDPKGPDNGKSRVLRGGSWHGYARRIRSAYRFSNLPGSPNDLIGFRVARDF